MFNFRNIFLIIIIAVFFNFVTIYAQSREYHHLPLGPNMIGPESIAFDCQGQGPYAGISDGRVMKWQGRTQGWTEFAVTSPYRSRYCDGRNEEYCGRPLGLKFDMRTCELYIADSSMGLMKVGSRGGLATSVSTGVNGVPFRFLNALDIDSDSGVVYFTDTSTRFHRWQFVEAMRSSDHTGRLLKYDPRTKAVTVLLDGLYFANGVALSKNKDYVLVAETTASQIKRLWLTGPRAGNSDIFVKLAGSPDNINRNHRGEFWVTRNPYKPVKLDEFGNILESLDTPVIIDSSDVIEFRDSIWVGSVVQPYVIYRRH